MNCLNCDENLADGSQILLYCKNEKTVYLTIKPELEVFFEERKTVLTLNETESKENYHLQEMWHCCRDGLTIWSKQQAPENIYI